MKFICIVVFICIVACCKAQTILVMEFVKVKDSKWAEALYFYENNWKLYRNIAISKNYISAYRIEKVLTDSNRLFDIVLITEYPSKALYEKSEENFSDILKTSRPNGPVLLNDIPPAGFRESVWVKITETLHKRDE